MFLYFWELFSFFSWDLYKYFLYYYTKKRSQHVLLCQCYFGVFFGLLGVMFLFFFRTVCFLMKFCTFNLDNTLMISSVKQNPIGYFFRFLGAILGMFLYFLQAVQDFFMKFCTDILAITLIVKSKNIYGMYFVAYFLGSFLVIFEPILGVFLHFFVLN